MSYRIESLERNKIGRPPKFATPKALWSAFVDYCTFVDDHPFEEEVIVKGEVCTKNIPRPYTFSGFMAFVGIGQEWSDFAKYQCKRNEDFYEVVTRIKNTIRKDQLEGGLTNTYNANLTARLNGLTEKQDITSNGEKIDLSFTIVDGKGK